MLVCFFGLESKKVLGMMGHSGFFLCGLSKVLVNVSPATVQRLASLRVLNVFSELISYNQSVKHSVKIIMFITLSISIKLDNRRQVMTDVPLNDTLSP